MCSLRHGATAGVKPSSWLVWCGVPWFLYCRITELRRSLAENCSIERFAWPLLKTLALQGEGSQVGKTVKKNITVKWLYSMFRKNAAPKKKKEFHGGNNNNDQELLNVVKWGRFSPSIGVSEAEWCRRRYDFNRTKRCSINIHCQHKQPCLGRSSKWGKITVPMPWFLFLFYTSFALWRSWCGFACHNPSIFICQLRS